MLKNKTAAVCLSFLGGPLGLHRFYLMGMGDLLGWALPIPTALGLYGVSRVQEFGVDDAWSWVLLPLLGFTIAGCALTAIVYGLMTPEKWNGKFNRNGASNAPAGNTNWLTVGAMVLSMAVGASALMFSVVYSFQGYFEHQIEAARKISQ